jgi:hypothetical protein
VMPSLRPMQSGQPAQQAGQSDQTQFQSGGFGFGGVNPLQKFRLLISQDSHLLFRDKGEVVAAGALVRSPAPRLIRASIL